ncbi:MAG: DUF2065 domain-containing protein [Alphaproteobacteria bacterium]
MSDFLVAIGLVLVIEGVVYAVFPGPMKKMLDAVRDMDLTTMRVAGIVAIGMGLLVVWLVRG